MNRITEWIIDHPTRVFVLAGLLTLGFATAIPFLGVEVDFKSFLDQDDPAVAALNLAEERYGSQEILIVTIEAQDSVFQSDVISRVAVLEDALEDLPGVDEILGPTTLQIIEGAETQITVSSAAREIPQTQDEMDTYARRLVTGGSRRCNPYNLSRHGQLFGAVHQCQQHENFITQFVILSGRDKKPAIMDERHVCRIQRAFVLDCQRKNTLTWSSRHQITSCLFSVPNASLSVILQGPSANSG